MHTAGKVLLIIGGVITALGIVMIVGGDASAGLTPTEENVWEGKSGSFTVLLMMIFTVFTSWVQSICGL